MTIHVRNWDRYKLAKGTRTDGTLRWIPAYTSLLEDDEFKGRGGWNRLGLWIAILLQAGRTINQLPDSDTWWRHHFGGHGPQIRDRFLASNHLEQRDENGTILSPHRPAIVPPSSRQDDSSTLAGHNTNGNVLQIRVKPATTEDTQGPLEKSREEKTLQPHYDARARPDAEGWSGGAPLVSEFMERLRDRRTG